MPLNDQNPDNNILKKPGFGQSPSPGGEPFYVAPYNDNFKSSQHYRKLDEIYGKD
jgi:hypothetical protein